MQSRFGALRASAFERSLVHPAHAGARATTGRTPVCPEHTVLSRRNISARTTSRSTRGPMPAACERTMLRWSAVRRSISQACVQTTSVGRSGRICVATSSYQRTRRSPRNVDLAQSRVMTWITRAPPAITGRSIRKGVSGKIARSSPSLAVASRMSLG